MKYLTFIRSSASLRGVRVVSVAETLLELAVGAYCAVLFTRAHVALSLPRSIRRQSER